MILIAITDMFKNKVWTPNVETIRLETIILHHLNSEGIADHLK
jgi:hypothetical protein